MDNMYRPTGDGDPQDANRTDQFWTPASGPSGAGPQDTAGPPPQPSHLEQHYARDRRHALRWTVGLSLALVLAAGGVIGGVALASHRAAGSGFSPASDAATAHNGTGRPAAAVGQPQSQAAALNNALNAAAAPGTLTLTSVSARTGSTVQAAATAAQVHACRRAVAALRAARRTGRPALIRPARAAVIARCHGIRRRLLRFVLLRGIDGQFTIRTRAGSLRTLAFERGVLQSVGGHQIVVRAVDGTTWSWDLVGGTVVREDGQKTSASALTSGEPVWVGGPVISGARDARLVVIRPPSPPAPSTATPAPSASGS